MKYDLTKCNNLRWECGVENDKHSGLCRVFKDSRTGEGTVSLVELTNMPYGLPREYNYACISPDDLGGDVPFANFCIVPRNPETYKDWQVGDVVAIDEFDEIDLKVVVSARINDIVVCSYIRESMVFGMFTCEELKKKGSLVLTDYEKKLQGTTECEFKDGDVVLVRDSNSDKWISGIFSQLVNDPYPYRIYNNGRYKQCIPYNEKTWRLLGTTDDYEEDE